MSNTTIPISVEIIRRCADARLKQINDEVHQLIIDYAQRRVKLDTEYNIKLSSKKSLLTRLARFIFSQKIKQVPTIEQVISLCYYLYNSDNPYRHIVKPENKIRQCHLEIHSSSILANQQ